MSAQGISRHAGQKIAVLNFKGVDGNFLGKALSCVSGYTLLKGRTPYEWRRLFGMDEKHLNRFGCRYLLASASVIEQIGLEAGHPQFVSIDAAFTGALSAGWMLERPLAALSAEEKNLLQNLLDFAGQYSANRYDRVIHIQNADSHRFDELSVKFCNRYRIACMIYDGGNMKDILEDVVRKLEITPEQTLEYAMAEAERAVYFKTWTT
jgi:hypothetical protein